MKPIILDGHPVKQNSPPPCDLSWFQKEIDRMFGLHSNGYSKFRIVYGQDLREGQAVEWDHTRQIWRARYLLQTKRRLEIWRPPGSFTLRQRYVYDDVGVPRWFVERYVPPEVACRGWVVEGIDSEGDYFYDPKPVNGLYEPFADSMIANHTPWCCAEASKEERACYGTYRAPDEWDLDAIREAKQMLDEKVERRPGIATPEELEKAQLRSQQRYEAWDQKLKDEATAIAYDALNTHQSSLSDDPSVVKHGRYHWLSGHTKSGLTDAERKEVLTDKSISIRETGDKYE